MEATGQSEPVTLTGQQATIQPIPGKLCTTCWRMATTETDFHRETTFRRIREKAGSCSLCAIFLARRQVVLEAAREQDERIDEHTIDDNRVQINVRDVVAATSGTYYRLIDLRLDTDVERMHYYFTVVSCNDTDSSATLPVWRSFPTTIDEKYRRMRIWFDACRLEHADCVPRSQRLPTRLLQIENSADPQLRLVDTARMPEQDVVYAALSYCWGSNGVLLRTTRENELQHRSQIPYRDLPRTFQDAVQIAQTLDIGYLWIDSLCILQDDPAEWKREATRMDQVYLGATLTIAASDGHSASSGFFASHKAPSGNEAPGRVHLAITGDDQSEPPLFVQVHDRGLPSRGRPDKALPLLRTRGWTLLESTLSQRVVHCYRSELYWRCNQGCQNESGLTVSATWNEPWNVPALDVENQPMHDVDTLWGKLIDDYSERNFTYPKDRLIAFAGLVNRFRAATGDSPCIGMWKGNIHQDLGWARCGSLDGTSLVNECTDRLPSWTWLSCPVGVWSHWAGEVIARGQYAGSHDFHARVTNWHTSWEGVPFKAAPEHAFMEVRGPVEGVYVYTEEVALKEQGPTPRCLMKMLSRSGATSSRELQPLVRWDTEHRRPAEELTCLHLSTSFWEGDDTVMETFLLLKRVNVKPETYRRIGIGQVDDSPDDKAFCISEVRKIRLI
ncbi:uncharacterized protein AB675_9587 [Cyphellophora attinorum]|uniref:Heterokaryon incompatibility domain-containing protein n=1 Tax=Cyphellophora attinorum TaxID=1664694 RepID=A0A0N0NPA8_9EURO|nr:uncharacterized protein AB675_9587 [Phialophora attinorum]KPI42508.1 hypothetical protein AB675_9587 [Phialophora attinorum]